MKIKLSVRAEVYEKMRKLYGPHVDHIELHKRPIKGKPGKYGYSATCSDHGVVSAWTTSMERRIARVQMHLKGAHD